MAEFGDNFEQDPAAEFLQREQSALAGLEDEIPPVNAQPSGKPATFLCQQFHQSTQSIIICSVIHLEQLF